MKFHALRLGLCVACLLALAGCDTFGGVGDTVSGWFSPTHKKSGLKGERISVMAEDTSLKPDPDLAKTQVVLPPPYINTEWPEPGGYATNAMYHLEAKGPLHTVWEADTGKGTDDDSRLTAPPVVADGRIFVLDAQAHVFAVNARDGKPLWNKSLAPEGPESDFFNVFGMFGPDMSIDPSKGFGGGTAYDAGKIFVSTGFGSVFALDAITGKQLWKADLGVPIVNAPVANGGRVFVSSEDNHFVALAQSDGRVLWDHQGISESAGILTSTSAAVSGDTVVVPYTSGELYAIRINTGTPEWNDMLTKSGNVTALSELDDIAGRPVIDRDMVFAISHSGLMAAINLNTGERVWSRDVGGIQSPWAAGDYVYVLTVDGQVLCLQRKDGKVKWLHPLPRWEDPKSRDGAIVWSGPVLVSDRLIFVSSSGKAISLSPYTGDLLGRVDIPDGTYIGPVVANGTLYLLTNSAQLVAMR
ncbi:MAG TPA: PQQ-binding-like beta-propeller repeat protein [Rhizomicrobium sp.]|jgi:outer membrane protein assembly factor BamB|nr:PQQ-binding-like beta-propeller repeat protein [Rhizomicrobium sp.]